MPATLITDEMPSHSHTVNDDVWGTWSNYTVSSVTSCTTWNNWITADSGTTTINPSRYVTYNDGLYLVPRELTPEEREEQKKREQEAAKARREEERRKKAASERARGLLLENLNPKQREQFEKNGWFVVEGGKSKKSYKIMGDRWAGNVYELHDAEDEKRAKACFCAHTPTHVPIEDNLLAQKLMLEVAEEEFLRIANVHWRQAA